MNIDHREQLLRNKIASLERAMAHWQTVTLVKISDGREPESFSTFSPDSEVGRNVVAAIVADLLQSLTACQATLTALRAGELPPEPDWARRIPPWAPRN
jgi:hypothetical protein